MASTDPEQWLDAHGDALFGYAMMRVQNQALMEDLVQEALLAGITSLENFAGKSSKCTWLVGVFKNKVVDHVRKARREQTYGADVGELG